MGRRLLVRNRHTQQFKEQLMIRILSSAMLVFLTGGVSHAGHCKSANVCAHVVQKQVVIKQVEPQVLYFVNPPQIAPSYQYQEVNQAAYGQIEREFQRLQDRMEELAAIEQQNQAYQQQVQPQYYAPPQQQWVPQQQVQPQCNTCEQAQQAEPQPECKNCQKPAVEELPPSEAEPIEPQPQPEQPPEKPPVFSQTVPHLLQGKCASCHSGDKAKGKFSIDGPMTWDKVRKIAKVIKHDEMPKDSGNNVKPLSDAEKEMLFRQLLSSL